MTDCEEGGEAPCFAHLLDQPPDHADEALAELAVAEAARPLSPTGT